MLLHVLSSKSKINDFIIEDRTKISIKLKHEPLGVTIDTSLNLYSCLNNYVRKLEINLKHWPELYLILIKICKYSLYSIFQWTNKLYPLIRTFCIRSSNNLINILKERALRVIYNDYDSSSKEL